MQVDNRIMQDDNRNLQDDNRIVKDDNCNMQYDNCNVPFNFCVKNENQDAVPWVPYYINTPWCSFIRLPNRHFVSPM